MCTTDHKFRTVAVYFKDIIIPASDDDDDDDTEDTQSRRTSTDGFQESRKPSSDELRLQAEPSKSLATQKSKRIHRVDRQKLIIILVGLPGRGKTFLCNKLMCYLNW